MNPSLFPGWPSFLTFRRPLAGDAIVAWAHPTSGIVPKCAPSLSELAFVEIEDCTNC